MTIAGADFYWLNGPVTGKLANLSFVVLKATEGTGYGHADWLYPNAQAVIDDGVLLGLYHFGRRQDGSVTAALAQYAAFISRCKGIPAVPDDLSTVGLALDQECSNPDNFTETQARAFIEAAHDDGFRIGLYCARSLYPDAWGQDWRWVADYDGDPPGIPYHVWQYAAVSGWGDKDVFNGTMAELRALWLGTEGDDMPDPRITDEMVAALAKLTPVAGDLRGIGDGSNDRTGGKPRPASDTPNRAAGWDIVDTALAGGPTPPGPHHHETGGAIPESGQAVTR